MPKKQTEKQFTRHPASAAMPPLTPEVFADLVGSMRESGFDSRKPIVTINDTSVIIGWHRYLAAKEAKIDPIVIDYGKLADANIRDLVYRDELARRHMTPSERADAVIALDRACGIGFAKAGDNQHTDEKPSAERTESESQAGSPITKRNVSQRAGVSEATAQRRIAERKQQEGLAAPKPPKPPEAPPPAKKDDDQIPDPCAEDPPPSGGQKGGDDGIPDPFAEDPPAPATTGEPVVNDKTGRGEPPKPRAPMVGIVPASQIGERDSLRAEDHLGEAGTSPQQPVAGAESGAGTDQGGKGGADPAPAADDRTAYLEKTIQELRQENEHLTGEAEGLKERLAIVELGASPESKECIDRLSNDAALIRTLKSQVNEWQSKCNEKSRLLKNARDKIRRLEKAKGLLEAAAANKSK